MLPNTWIMRYRDGRCGVFVAEKRVAVYATIHDALLVYPSLGDPSTHSLPDNWQEIDSVASYNEAVIECGRQVKAGRELPMFFRSIRIWTAE
jgi:hypothetical protein